MREGGWGGVREEGRREGVEGRRRREEDMWKDRGRGREGREREREREKGGGGEGEGGVEGER